MAAAAANGTLTPPLAPASPAPAKRKHVAKHAVSDKSASLAQQTGTLNGNSTYTLQNALQDIFSVLQNYDTTPSILDHPITSAIARSPTGEADAKRAKLTPPTTPATIAGLIRDGSYKSFQALVKDAENVIADIEASRTSDDSSNMLASPISLDLQGQISAFQNILKGLTAREGARLVHSSQLETREEAEDIASVMGETPTEIKEEGDEVEFSSRTVLTLYGTANGPKQLFSSLQQPHRVHATGAEADIDTGIKITLPLRESALPNILSTTEVYPIIDQVDSKKKAVTTIGEIFRAPAHLPQISPPKAPKPIAAKGNVITFAPQEVHKPSRKGSHSYTNQNLSAGFWLGYGGVDMPKDQTSPTAKQKSRQRALSMGESQQPPSETILVAIREAKEDALFRSAYSSFAPTRDDTSAIVPEEIKNRLWWKRVGEKRFNEIFPIDPSLEGNEVSGTVINGHAEGEEEFKEAVENFVPVDESNPPWLEGKTEEDKDTDEILTDISELLETLASHQRIRNSSLTTNPRTPVVQNSSLASLAGSPSTPSTEEVDVYNILKSQLTLLVSQLPPYAVAKLNGDQLEELNISRTILFDTKEYKGVLEEDPLSKLSKVPAASTAPAATLNRSNSGTHSHFAPGGTQYTRPAPSHSSSSRTVQGSQSYFPQQSVNRSSSMQYQRSPSGQTQTFQPGGVSYTPAPRSGLPVHQSINQQTPRPGYGQSSSQYYTPRPTQPGNYSSTPSSQYYNATSQAQSQQRHGGQSIPNGVYTRSQPVAPMYGSGQTQQNRTASPLKASSSSAQPMYSSRTGMSTPIPGGQLRSTYFGPSQYGTPQAASASTSSAGYNGMSSAAQQLMIDRQQAQVVAQSQARLAAQSSFSRQGSGTPQPSNGTYGGQANGVPLSN